MQYVTRKMADMTTEQWLFNALYSAGYTKNKHRGAVWANTSFQFGFNKENCGPYILSTWALYYARNPWIQANHRAHLNRKLPITKEPNDVDIWISSKRGYRGFRYTLHQTHTILTKPDCECARMISLFFQQLTCRITTSLYSSGDWIANATTHIFYGNYTFSCKCTPKILNESECESTQFIHCTSILANCEIKLSSWKSYF